RGSPRDCAGRTLLPGRADLGTLRPFSITSVGMSAHNSLVRLAILGAGAALLTLAPILRVPYPILLVVGGLALGFVRGIPHVALRPDVVLVAILPPLLYSSAF